MSEDFENFILNSEEYKTLREEDKNSVCFQVTLLAGINIVFWVVCIASMPIISTYSNFSVIAWPLVIISLFCLLYCIYCVAENHKYYPEIIRWGCVVESANAISENPEDKEFWDDSLPVYVEVDGKVEKCFRCSSAFMYDEGDVVLVWQSLHGWNKEKCICLYVNCPDP